MEQSLAAVIRAGYALITIDTLDEERAIDLIDEVATELKRETWTWSVTTGLRTSRLLPDIAGQLTQASSTIRDVGLTAAQLAGVPTSGIAAGAAGSSKNPHDSAITALQEILRKKHKQALFVFCDLAPHCGHSIVARLLRDILEQFERTNSTLILINAQPLPEATRQFAYDFELPWPDAKEIEEIIRSTLSGLREREQQAFSAKLARREFELLLQSLRGLTPRQIRRMISGVIIRDGGLASGALEAIVDAKRRLLGSIGCLESLPVDVGVDDIGGLQRLKDWLRQRRGGFTRSARDFGLMPPRGVLMLGVPGCGKSLCAKAVAAEWDLPLLRFDPGRLYQRYVGESEGQLRRALAQAEAMSPTILWIDEIEKAFASASGESSDGGLSKRMFGTLLSWMQEHRHPIFIIATANDVVSLPPELLRKGRFDEIFFVDLPNAETLAAIFAIQLRRRGRNPEAYALPQLAAAAAGFSGAEVEQAVLGALYRAFSQKTELGDEHLLAELAETRPISVLNAEKVTRIRAWAATRCVPAD